MLSMCYPCDNYTPLIPYQYAIDMHLTAIKHLCDAPLLLPLCYQYAENIPSINLHSMVYVCAIYIYMLSFWQYCYQSVTNPRPYATRCCQYAIDVLSTCNAHAIHCNVHRARCDVWNDNHVLWISIHKYTWRSHHWMVRAKLVTVKKHLRQWSIVMYDLLKIILEVHTGKFQGTEKLKQEP